MLSAPLFWALFVKLLLYLWYILLFCTHHFQLCLIFMCMSFKEFDNQEESVGL